MTSDPAAPAVESGQILNNRYELGAPLGQGGMGQVFLATDVSSGERVALKTFLPGRDSTDQRRFEREIRTLKTLDHPGIVPFKDVGWEGDLLFYTMGYLPGASLEEVIAASGAVAHTEQLDWYLRVLIQVTEALGYLHERRLVHRDVKPANLLVTLPREDHDLAPPPADRWIADVPNAVACLTDFGLVKARDSERSLTQTSLGTPQYMSPEQIESSPAVDERSDLYSLGVVLYRIATGRLPYERLSDVLARRPYRPLREINPELPELLEDAVARLLDFEPYRRPADAAEAKRLLTAVLHRKSLGSVGESAISKLAQPSFCGRSAELRTLKKVAEQAARGVGQWAAVRGERGTGKTWLIQRSDLKSHALVKEKLVSYAGRFSTQRPHAAFRALLEDILRHFERHHGTAAAVEALGPWGRALQTFIPQLAIDDLLEHCPPLEPMPAEFAKERVSDAILRVLTASAEIEPRILVFEDLHHGSEEDLELVRRLILSAIPLPILVITTHRPEFETRSTRLTRFLHEIRSQDRLTEIELGAFTPGESRQMIESMLVPARRASNDFVHVLVERTGGIPLYLLHLLNSLWKRGSIRAEGAEWIVDAEEVRALPIPESTRSHFLLILDDLPSDQLKVLNFAAAIGTEFSFELLLDVSGLDEFELDTTCRSLVHAGIFEEKSEGFRFLHSFEQEILLSRLSAPMRRRLHARVGKSMERLFADEIETHLGQIAEQLYLGGDQERGVGYLHRAAERAEHAYAPSEALGYYEKALEFLPAGAPPEGVPTRRSILTKIGTLHQQLGNPDEALQRFTEAMQHFTAVEQLLLADTELDDAQREELRAYGDLLMMFGDFYGKSGEVDPALKNYEKAGAIARKIDDPSGIAYSLVRRGVALILREKFDEAREAYLEAVKLYEELPPAAGLVAALTGLSRIDVFQGGTDRALTHAERALGIAEEIHDRVRSASLLSTIGTIKRRQGDFNAAIASFEQSIDLLETLGDRRGLAMGLGNLGLVYSSRGEFRKSLESFERAREIFQLLGDKMGVLQTIGNIGTLRYYQGDFNGARKWQAEYLSEARERRVRRFEADALVSHGLVELECGDLEDAEAHFREGAEIFRSAGDQSEAGLPLVYLSRALARQGDIDRARDTLDLVLTEQGAARNETVAEAKRVWAEIQLEAGEVDEAEENAVSALEIFEKLALPYREGTACRTLGKIYCARGYYWADQTGKYFERSLRMFERLGARHALAIAQLEYGTFLGLMDERERALEYLERAEPVFEELGMPRELERVRRELEEISR